MCHTWEEVLDWESAHDEPDVDGRDVERAADPPEDPDVAAP